MDEDQFLYYDEPIYLTCNCPENEFLFSRGFIDDQLHLAPHKTVECEFTIEQKHYQSAQRKTSKKQVVVFGTEVLIRHVFSNYYLSFSGDLQGNDRILLRKEVQESCYFQLIPQRSFQHKGDSITLNSSFGVLHSDSKSYLGSNLFEMDPIKHRIRTELKNSRILQSYHMINNLSEKKMTQPPPMNQINLFTEEEAEGISKVQIQKREPLNQEIKMHTPKFQRVNSLNSEIEVLGQQGHILPIEVGKGERQHLMPCAIEKHPHTMWRAQKKQSKRTLFLNDNDYVYFVSSLKNKGTMLVSPTDQGKSYRLQFVFKHGESEYESSSLFIVEVQQTEQDKQQRVYLKHLITGRYFPFTQKNVKKRLKLVPLLPSTSYQNKLPPFHIFFDGQFFPRQFLDYQSTCGFWLNKISKLEINQILSLESMSHTKWIPYLTDYLDSERHRKQQLLRQFGLLRHMVFNVIKQLKGSKQLYRLLFKMINQNKKIRREMAEYVGELVKSERKEYLMDIFSEIFNNNDNLVERYIQSEHLAHEINDFKIEDAYSTTYMRIFRLFCGHYQEPCERNQNAIYELFFGEAEGSFIERKMTESYLRLNLNKIPDKFKFRFRFGPEKQIHIQNNSKEYEYSAFPQEVQMYLRQYLYLLGDCLKQNKPKIEEFKKKTHHSMDNLLDILGNKNYCDLHGPVINLINVAYLDPEYKYKLYVYIKDYDQMCYNGALVALQKNESIKRLLAFINKEQDDIKELLYNLDSLKAREKVLKDEKIPAKDIEQLVEEENQKVMDLICSTKLKRFLIMVKHSIENGYWDNISNLQIIVDTLSNLYRKKEEKLLTTHEDYEQVHCWKNYMDSTVLIIDIVICYIDIQINLCISNLINLRETQVSNEIEEFVKSLQQNRDFQNRLDYFQLTNVQNEQLMKKSLILSRKYFEIKSIILKKYSEDIAEKKSSLALKDSIQFIKGSIEDIKLNNSISINKCKQYIYCCLKGVDLKDLQPQEMLKTGYSLRPAFKYKFIATEFQSLAFKLGVLDLLTDGISRYINLRSKQKNIEKESIYWKILLLYVLIKDNKVLKKQIISMRNSFIHLVAEENHHSFVALDILTEIYSNNRSIVMSDREELYQLCSVFKELMDRDHKCEFSSKNHLNIKINKLLRLIQTFLTVQGKKIKSNFSVVLNELFEKDALVRYICKLKNIHNQQLGKQLSSKEDSLNNTDQLCNNYLFQILLFKLTRTLEQKPEKMNFTLPHINQTLDLILKVGKNNFTLIFDIYSLIPEGDIHSSEVFITYFKTTVTQVCQVIFEEFKNSQHSNKKEFGEYSDQMQSILIHFPILIKITRHILQGPAHGNLSVLEPVAPHKLEAANRMKLELLERLFLFNHYLENRVVQKLVGLAREHLSSLLQDESYLDKLLWLDFQILSAADLKDSSNSLVQINQKKKNHLSRLKRLDSKIVIRKSKNEQMLELVGLIGHFVHSKHNLQMQLQNSKEFIKAITYINRKDQNHLDPDLKTFFLKFLIGTFPKQPYDEEDREKYNESLEQHQIKLIEYGSAELVCSMLQQRFKQNYQMFIHLFEYGNKLLEGGNQAAQHSFYEIFLGDHKNVTFQNIRIIIENSTIGMKFYYHSYPKLDNPKLTVEEEIVYPDNRNTEAVREKKNFCLMMKRIFRFLQLLCENDNQLLKKYIYKQINEDKEVKYMSVNFLEIAINNFSQLMEIAKYNIEYNWPEEEDREQSKDVVDDLLDALLFTLDFLIEVCQYPAHKNQAFICNTDFFDNIGLINELKVAYQSVYQNKDDKTLLSIQRKIIILLRGLLEQKSKTIIESLTKKLDIEGLTLFVQSSLESIGISTRQQLIDTMSKNHDKLVEEIENVVDILIVTSALGVRLEDRMPSHYGLLDEIRKQIREIEVDFKGQLTTICFCYRPIFNYLSHDTKEYFVNQFSRHESRNDKLKDVINMRHIINQDILQRKSRQLIMSETTTNALFSFSILLCYILVALELFFFSVNRIGIALDHIQANIIHGIALAQFSTSLMYFVLWGINISPITLQKIKEKHHKSSKPIERKEWKAKIKHYYILIKQIYIEEGSSLHAVLLLAISIFSCFFEVRMYSFVLLYIFAKIQLLRDILSAISVTWRQLVLVSLLSMAFNFIFGMLSINNYINVLYQNESIDIDIDHITDHCSTIMSCIDSLFAQRIIGETPSRVGDNSHYGRLFSDAIYWAFFDIIIPNLTAAIIIDKFAELRNSKQKIEKQQHNKCLICFADKWSIERKGESFEEHKLKKHCIWDYFYYLYYLEKLKSNTEYTGVEYWIVEQIKNEKIEWFPLDESQKEDSGEKKAEALMEMLRKKMMEENWSNREVQDE